MADAAREAGAEIRTGAEVERILVDGRPRRGVELAERRGGARRRACSRTPTRSDVPAGWSSDGPAAGPVRRRDARLPLRGDEHEDQPRGRPAAGRGGRRRRRACSRTTGGIMEVNADHRRDGPRPGRGARRAARRPTRTSSSASPPSTTRRWRPTASTCVTIDVNSQPYTLADGHLGRDPRRASPTARSRSSRATSRPERLDRRTARCSARSTSSALLGITRRPRAARRHVVRPALHPAPGPRLGRLPDAGRGPLPVRCRHPSRRRGDAARTAATAPARSSATPFRCADGYRRIRPA